MDSVITTFNIAVTETVCEILGKYCQKKKPWVTAEILDLFNERRELRKKRLEPEGSEKQENEQYQKVHEEGKRKLDRRIV